MEGEDQPLHGARGDTYKEVGNRLVPHIKNKGFSIGESFIVLVVRGFNTISILLHFHKATLTELDYHYLPGPLLSVTWSSTKCYYHNNLIRKSLSCGPVL